MSQAINAEKGGWLVRTRRLSVKEKILFSGIALAVLPVLVSNFFLGGRALYDGERIATYQANQLLSALRDTKKSQLSDYFNNLDKQLTALAAASGTVSACQNLTHTLLDPGDIDPPSSREITSYRNSLRKYYSNDYATEYSRLNPDEALNVDYLTNNLDRAATWLQYRYVKLNPFPINQKQMQNNSVLDELPYDREHEYYHPGFRKLIEQLGYRDLYLIDLESDRVVYSVLKQADFAVSLTGTTLENAGIGKLYHKLKNNEKLTFAVEDFKDYLPSYHSLVGFAGVPVYNKRGERIAILMVQLADTQISGLLTNNGDWQGIGLGQSGEVYVVNSNSMISSDVRPFLESHDTFVRDAEQAGMDSKLITHMDNNGSTAGVIKVAMESVKQALAGNSSVVQEQNYLGQDVLTAYGLLSAYGLKWVVLAQMQRQEALAPVAQMDASLTKTSWTVAVLVVIGAVLLAMVFARTLTAPLESIEGTVRRLNAGDFDARCRMTTGDEYQSLGDAIDSMVDERTEFLRSQEASQLLNEHIIQVLEAVSELSNHNLTVNVPVTEDIIGPVADSINLMTEEISDLMRQVQHISDDVGNSSEELATLATDVNTLSEAERRDVEQMADKLETSSHSLTAIAEVAERSNGIARQARERVLDAHETVGRAASGMHDIREVIHETEKRIKRLGERSQEISGITDIINTIAERTHVLSINASMQAAAAGEAGRGFSVVAEEVQRLAESSRNATAQIATLVKNIQIETVDASETMARTIEQVVAGTRLADDAGRIMKESDAITASLAETVQQIAEQSTAQSAMGQALLQDAEGLRTRSIETAGKIQAQHTKTGQLAEFATRLRQAIATFKLG